MRASRTRTVAAPVGDVWRLVSDPHNLPRWWPHTSRVENVSGSGRRAQWTMVLETVEGRGVRADYRCLSSAENERFVWEQDLEGTPFERYLRASRVEIGLMPRESETEVTIVAVQMLKGMSRLGAPMLRRGQGAIADEALDGIERALT